MHSHDTTQPAQNLKRCSKCGEWLPRSEFHVDKRKRDGLRCACKQCQHECKMAYLEANRERVRKLGRAHYAATAEEHREHERTTARIYYAKTKEQRAAKMREYRAANPEKEHARNLLKSAVRGGKLPRPDTQFCFICGISADQGAVLEYHHVDYSKPLEVISVCANCHARWHMPLDID